MVLDGIVNGLVTFVDEYDMRFLGCERMATGEPAHASLRSACCSATAGAVLLQCSAIGCYRVAGDVIEFVAEVVEKASQCA